MNRAVLKKFECPICFVTMKPPIYLCSKGHSFCNTCFEQIDTCGTCRSSLTNNRNYLVEDIMAILEYPCKYDDCIYKGILEDLKEHELKCEFKPYLCPFDNDCDWKSNLVKMRNHIKEKHECIFLSDADRLTINCIGFKKSVLNYNDNLFLVVVKASRYDLKIGIQTFDRNNDRQKYKYTIRFIDPDNIEDFSFTKVCGNYVISSYCHILAESIDFSSIDGRYNITCTISNF